MIAAALGATVIEKHFTLDRTLSGPDHKASLEPDELKQMIQNIRITETILGSFDKKPTTSEEEIKPIVRKSIVATVDIPKGTLITKHMVTIKRPGTGIQPSNLENIIGQKAKIAIPKDTVLKNDMIE